jgi:rhamnogalacturonyl hydrolase YesR
MERKLRQSIAGVAGWVEAHGYRAYDPGDGNLSYLHALTGNVLLLERLLQQAVYRAPFNLRPLLGIAPHISTKGIGYMAWGYVKMYRITGDPSFAERAFAAFDWLIRNSSPRYPQYCWGNHFPFSTRSGKTPALEPIVPWTTLIGQSFLEAYETFGTQAYLDVARSAAEWVGQLPREHTATGDCISYVAFKQNSIHNSNLLAASLLAQIGKLTRNAGMLEVAGSAVEYSCSRMRADGSWYYGEQGKFHWIDNFHTGYNLDALKRYVTATGDDRFAPELRRGFSYFKEAFFEKNGRPKYYHDRALPTDIQCAAQAIDTLTFLSDGDTSALSLAEKVAGWTIDHMQGRDGHFFYRDLGWVRVRTPMLHWGQGTMFKALAHLLGKVASPRVTPTAKAGMADAGDILREEVA